MDFLGLKTLTVIEDTVESDPETRTRDFSIENILFDDQAAFDPLQSRGTIGLCSRWNRGGMTSPAKQFDVRKIIMTFIALIALYRPGPWT